MTRPPIEAKFGEETDMNFMNAFLQSKLVVIQHQLPADTMAGKLEELILRADSHFLPRTRARRYAKQPLPKKISSDR